MTRYVSALFIVFIFISGCNRNKSKPESYDTPYSGTINISADESYRPVIEEQVKMYESTYPGTKINARFKPEADCLRDLFYDSLTRMVIITRGLTPAEEKFFKDSMSYYPGWQRVASDAIAILVNSSSNDTLFTLDRLREQLKGKINRNQQIVFDGLKATSTVRFIRDSVLKGQPFDTSVVKAARNTADVINYVQNNPDAIGLIGISWIGNPEDTSQKELLRKVKIAMVECEVCEGKPFVKPLQASIITSRYPLVRGLFYVNRENYTGLGSGFSSFLKSERGQLIFRRSYLGPVMDLDIRRIKINID